MKLEDLMLNDWVLHKGEPCKVVGINNRLYLERNERVFLASPQEVSPIPLTPEILEKNGFDCSDKEIARLYFEDGDYKEPFTLRAMYEKETGIQKGWGFFAFNVLVVLDYVHKLQHALRMCGIEKTINL